MFSRISSILVTFVLTTPAHAEECTAAWQHDLSTGAVGPKAFNGDTYAAYAAFAYQNDNRTGFRLKGKFPNVRFFSVESYRSKKNSDYDATMDRDLIADQGSVNPFVTEGAWGFMDQSFTLEIVPKEAPRAHVNTLRIDPSSKQGSIWLRYYAPNSGVRIAVEDLPSIEAFDPFTGLPKDCPAGFDIPYFTAYPQALTRIVPRKTAFDFDVKDIGLAGNNAVPGYSYGVTKMSKGDVMVVRMKPPTFSSTFSLHEGETLPTADVRYWSLCSQDVAGNVGLGCLADYRSVMDANGYVTTVISQSTRAKARALALGLNYIPDLRREKQSILLMTYRNILPTPAFRETVYRGIYTPQAKVCSEAEYLQGACDF